MLKLQLSIQRNYKINYFPVFPKAKVYLEPIEISKMEYFAILVNSFIPLTVVTKSSILDVWLGPKDATKSFFLLLL